ncbi:MAG: DUF4160 domain-containing protein [Ardenticatenaceae bacterium]
MEVKFWLEPIALARNYGFRQRELRKIRKLLTKHLEKIFEKWNEHCNPN